MARPRDFDLECKVYVGELGHGCSKDELEEKFSKYGTLRNVWVARRPAGFAFIEFDDPRDAEDAVRALDGTRINGRRARVEMSSGRSRSGGGRNWGPPQRSGPRYDDYRPIRRSLSPRRQRSVSPRRRSPSPRRQRSRSRSDSPRFRRRSRSYDNESRSRSRN